MSQIDGVCPDCGGTNIRLNIGGQEYYCLDCDCQWANPSVPVPIPLPPEPPRDRVIEAVDAEGQVLRRWSYQDGSWWHGKVSRTWTGVLLDAVGYSFTLRHVAAKEARS